MHIAIHQPNYIPWAGYFRKLAQADVFVILDDAQFPKNSYVNRVNILETGKASWLTIPAKPKLGTLIRDVKPAQPDWPSRHLSRLRNAYATAPYFEMIWPELASLYETLNVGNLATSNFSILKWLSDRLGLSPRFVFSSDYQNSQGLRGDDRLIHLVSILSGSTYISGQGGATYQVEAKFNSANIRLMYTNFSQPPYRQTTGDFVPGMSILDVAFNIGWEETASYVKSPEAAA